jgi:hypothetical protein
VSVQATAVVRKEARVSPENPGDKVSYAVLSVVTEDGKKSGLPRYLSGFRELAVLLTREAGVTHDQLHERFAYYERGEEVRFCLTFESDEALKEFGFDAQSALSQNRPDNNEEDVSRSK